MSKPTQSKYTIRKHGDNYGLYFHGALVECGVFATRKTAEKHKRIAENERTRYARYVSPDRMSASDFPYGGGGKDA